MIYRRIADLLIRYRVLLIVVSAIATPFAALAASRIGYDFSPQNLFAGDDDNIEFAEQFKDSFDHQDNVVLIALQAANYQSRVCSHTANPHDRVSRIRPAGCAQAPD